MSVLEVLARAKQLIETHGWVQGDYGGEDCGFCLFGAIDEATERLASDIQNAGGDAGGFRGMHGTYPAMRRLKSLLPMVSDPYDDEAVSAQQGVIQWNDTDGRSKEEVLALLTEALSVPPETETTASE